LGGGLEKDFPGVHIFNSADHYVQFIKNKYF